MKRKPSSKKSAFSLVELSIVLIIIGLLVAGVTGGSALIKGAEVRSVLAEAKDFKTLASTFYSTYNAYPGDYINSPVAIAGGAAAGDGNGVIEAQNAATGFNETTNAWLQVRGMPGVGTGLVSATSVHPSTTAITPALVGNVLPASKTKGAMWSFDYASFELASAISINKNILLLSSGIRAQPVHTPGSPRYNTGHLPGIMFYGISTPPNNQADNYGIFTPTDAAAVDSKVDDGIPIRGTIRAANNNVSGGFSCMSGGGVYSTTISGKNCALSFDLDI